MPSAMWRACSVSGCPELTTGGPCPVHARQREQARGSARARGYSSSWDRFRPYFIRLLIQAGIVPLCGARLVGPPSPHSRCAARGLLTDRSADGSDLHFDHDPPLTEAERHDDAAVCDKYRITLLCRACHSVKTQTEQREHR